MTTREAFPHERAFDRRLGSVLRERRKEEGLSLQKLSVLVGVTWQVLGRYEHGETRVSASRLVSIAAALDATPQELLAEAMEGKS